MKLKIDCSNDIARSDLPTVNPPIQKQANLQSSVNRSEDDMLSGNSEETCQFLSENPVDILYKPNDDRNKIYEAQTPVSTNIKVMVEAEALAIHRRAFLSPQCVDYPDVVGIKD